MYSVRGPRPLSSRKSLPRLELDPGDLRGGRAVDSRLPIESFFFRATLPDGSTYLESCSSGVLSRLVSGNGRERAREQSHPPPPPAPAARLPLFHLASPGRARDRDSG